MTPVYLYTPHMFICPHTFISPNGGANTPTCPHTPLCIFLLRGICLLWGLQRAPYMLDTSHTYWTPLPIWRMPPHMSYSPHSLVGFPVYQYVWGYLHVTWGIFPLCWGFGGVAPYVGVWGHLHICQALVPGSTSIGCPLCFSLYLFCSSLCLSYLPVAMTTTPLVMVVSSGLSCISSVTMAPSLMGLPATLGQCEVVLPPALTLRCPEVLLALPLCHSSNLHL